MNAEATALLAAIEAKAAELNVAGAAPDILADDVVAWMIEQKMFKLFVPRALGGVELSLSEAVRIYDALAAIDGSLGWQAQIGAGGGYFVPDFQPEISRQLFGAPEAVVAGSGYPAGIARPVPGGYMVSGRWRYASGAQYATVITANALVEEGGAQRIQALAFEPKQVKMIRDWDAFGMQRTSSWSFVVDEAFVPQERAFLIGQRVWDPGYSVYYLPFDLFAVASISAVAIGVARSFFTAAFQPDPVTGSSVGGRGAEVLQSAQVEVERFRQLMFTTIAQLEAAQAAGSLDENQCSHFTWMLQHAVHSVRDLVLKAMPHLGIRATRPSDPTNRIIRDLLTACQHVVMRTV